MPLHLAENEVGFATDWLGFPSISGCMAVVAVTDNGLFGVHDYGGGGSDRAIWVARAARFAAFVRVTPGGGTIRKMYGVCFPNHKRGYLTDVRRKWRNELAAFASALNFTGPLRGHDLGNSLPAQAIAGVGSAYVELRKAGRKCEIWVKAWTPGIAVTMGPVTSRDHMLSIAGNGVHGEGGHIGRIGGQAHRFIDRTGVQRVHSTRLRG